VLAGSRATIARAITLVESARPEHREAAQQLLMELLEHAGGAHRVGISGVPGVGKSTFIEELGTRLTAEGHRVAVLAVDPSSTRTRGSILGDKTRMARLAVDDNAFIRPSPTAGTLGGVARATRESIVLMEAAGYDVVLVETVGVGQSEVEVAGLADTSVVLLAPGMGDGIQAAKAGILEIGDVFVVNKADRDGADATVRDLRHMISLGDRTEPGLWRPPVVKTVAAQKVGVDEVMEALDKHRAFLEENGELARRRETRVADEIETIALTTLRARLGHVGGHEGVTALARDVMDGRTDPYAAADRLVEQLGP
jgi:LAO/AO transport system kinase